MREGQVECLWVGHLKLSFVSLSFPQEKASLKKASTTILHGRLAVMGLGAAH